MELLHTFSLVHDDLMDQDATRRGTSTIHEAYDDAAAILAGDVLFALAFETLDELPPSSTTARIAMDLARTARCLCEGQHLDMAYEDAWPTVDEYETMIEKKTAELFASACRNGARVAEDQGSITKNLGRFGLALGMAFQIQDDILDLDGNEEALGKPVGSDIRAGKKTHPILVAREQASAEDRQRLEDILDGEPSPSEVAWVIDLVETTGSIDASRDGAAQAFQKARSHLEDVPESPALDDLEALLNWLVDRDR